VTLGNCTSLLEESRSFIDERPGIVGTPDVAMLEAIPAEVEEQALVIGTGHHTVPHVCDVGLTDRCGGPHLDQDLVETEERDATAAAQRLSLVKHGVRDVGFEGNRTAPQLCGQSLTVELVRKRRAECAANLHGGTDNDKGAAVVSAVGRCERHAHFCIARRMPNARPSDTSRHMDRRMQESRPAPHGRVQLLPPTTAACEYA